MKSYLTKSDIEEIKAMKYTAVNYAELNELKKVLEKNNKKITTDYIVNQNNIFDIYYNKHKNTIESDKLSQEYRENNPFIGCTPEGWKINLFGMFFDQVDQEGFRIYKIAGTSLHEYKGNVEDKLKKLNIDNFDIESFILNKDFDFSPYTVEGFEDKITIDNIINLSLNVLNFFDTITKGCDEKTKEDTKNNFFERINYILKNVSREDIIKKDTNFRDLLIYLK